MREGEPELGQDVRQRTGAMRGISQLHLPMRRPEDVIPYLGSPGHWRDGRSAKLVAESWFAAKDRPELHGLPEMLRVTWVSPARSGVALVYGAAATRRLRTMGIRDKPIAPGSPWQNGFAERLIGSIRRECVHHILVLSETHLRRILKSDARYYNEMRTHRSLDRDAPLAIFSADMGSFDFKLHKPEQVRQSVMEKLKKHGKGIVLLRDFQHATAEAAMDLFNDLKAGGYKVVFMKPKYSVTTITSYDEAILKRLKGPMTDTRPTSSVVRTISE